MDLSFKIVHGGGAVEFVANYWWLWLIAIVISLGFAVYRQVSRTQKLARATVQTVTDFMKSDRLDRETAVRSVVEIGKTADKFMSGIKALVFAAVVAALSGILLVISIIINVAKLFTH